MKKFGFLILGILIVDVYFIYLYVSNLQDDGYQVLNVSSSVVQELYSKVNPTTDATVLKSIYQEEKFENQYILSISISNYLKEKKLQSPLYINPLEVEHMVHSIFGYDIRFNHEDTYLFSNGVCGYRYNVIINRYENMGGCDGNSNEKFYRKVVSAEQTGDWILITEKMIYLYDDWDTEFSRKYVYNHFNREKVLDVFETSSREQTDISIEDYFNDASTYIYYFRLKNGEYLFKGIKRVI